MSQRSVKNIQFCCHKRRWETSRCFPDLFSWTSCEKQAVLFLLTRLETSISLVKIQLENVSFKSGLLLEMFQQLVKDFWIFHNQHSWKMSGCLLKNIQWFQAYKCRNTVWTAVSHHHQPVDIKVILQTREADTTRSARPHLQNSAELCVSY